MLGVVYLVVTFPPGPSRPSRGLLSPFDVGGMIRGPENGYVHKGWLQIFVPT